MAFESQQLIRLNDIILFITDELEKVCDNVGKIFEDLDFANRTLSIQLNAVGIHDGKHHVPRYEKHSGNFTNFNQCLEQYGINPSERYIIKSEVQYLLQTAFDKAGLNVYKTILTNSDQLYFISQIVSQFIQKHIKIYSAPYFNKKAIIFFRDKQNTYVLTHFLAGSLFPISFNFLDGQSLDEQKTQLFNYFKNLISEVILQCKIEVTRYRAFISSGEYIDDDPEKDPWEDSDTPPENGDKDKPDGWQPGDPIPVE